MESILDFIGIINADYPGMENDKRSVGRPSIYPLDLNIDELAKVLLDEIRSVLNSAEGIWSD